MNYANNEHLFLKYRSICEIAPNESEKMNENSEKGNKKKETEESEEEKKSVLNRLESFLKAVKERPDLDHEGFDALVQQSLDCSPMKKKSSHIYQREYHG